MFSSRPIHRISNAGMLLSVAILLFFTACTGNNNPDNSQASRGDKLQAPGDQGVHFEDSLTWTAVRAKAKAENKYIFVDCYTSWCGPCKMMAREVFPQPVVGEYFNKQFISIGVQLDSTAQDDTLIRRRYTLGHLLKTKFEIHAFPTFLVFNADGLPLHRMTGARRDPADLIRDVSEAYDTTKQFYTQLDQFFKGRRDSAFMTRLSKIRKKL